MEIKGDPCTAVRTRAERVEEVHGRGTALDERVPRVRADLAVEEDKGVPAEKHARTWTGV